jgi:hypothetical protein
MGKEDDESAEGSGIVVIDPRVEKLEVCLDMLEEWDGAITLSDKRTFSRRQLCWCAETKDDGSPANRRDS